MEDKDMKEVIENIIGIEIDNNDKTEKETVEEILGVEIEEEE